MLEILWSVVGPIVKALNFVPDVWVSVAEIGRLSNRAPAAKVLPDPKVLTPTAKRALAEAEQRRRGKHA
jgi:hypothetical protein